MSVLQTEANQTLLHFAPIVEGMARKLARNLPCWMDREDLVQDGYVGLLEAERRFDPARGGSLMSYASSRVRGRMLDSLRAQDWMSRPSRRRCRDLVRAEEKLLQQLGRQPVTRELGQQLGLTPAEVERRRLELANSFMRSLDAEGPEGDMPARQLVDDFANVEGEFERAESHRALAQAIARLPERERQIVTWYYLENVPAKEISIRLKVSEPRVSQLHKRALNQMRERMILRPAV